MEYKIRCESVKECKEVRDWLWVVVGGGGGGIGSDTINYLDFSVFSLLSQ